MSQNLIQRHVEQTDHKEDFREKIMTQLPDHTDLMIAATFNITLNRVEASLLKNYNLYTDRHEHRDMRGVIKQVCADLIISLLEFSYILYHESRKARYVPNYRHRTKIKTISDFERRHLLACSPSCTVQPKKGFWGDSTT